MSNSAFFKFLGLPLLTLMPGLVDAADYVPPPSGPYQSSVVIKSGDDDANDSQQVYRFPPADLALELESEPASTRPAPENSANLNQFPDPVFASPPSRPPSQQFDNSNIPRPMSAPPGSPPAPRYDNARGNSWYQAPPQGIREGQWYGSGAQQQPYYPYAPQQAYPYAYPYGSRPYGSNEYENWSGPFGNMPSPWNMMRDNPFFSE